MAYNRHLQYDWAYINLVLYDPGAMESSIALIDPCSHSNNDQINLAVVFWYLVKSDGSDVRYCTPTYTGIATFYKIPGTHDYV